MKYSLTTKRVSTNRFQFFHNVVSTFPKVCIFLRTAEHKILKCIIFENQLINNAVNILFKGIFFAYIRSQRLQIVTTFQNYSVYRGLSGQIR